MDNQARLQAFQSQSRSIEPAVSGDELLGPLKYLPGVWKNTGTTEAAGWNCIALPFKTDPPPAGFNYRLLVNQYNETLNFETVNKAVPNRGLTFNPDGSVDEADQLIVTLNYVQTITQVDADDFPKSGKAGGAGDGIHHEPGLFLNMSNFTTNEVDVARLGSVPHGDSLLVLGKSAEIDGPPKAPESLGFPIGGSQDLNAAYLAPYKHFNDNPFMGTVKMPGFPGFNPIHPSALLDTARPGNVVKTTVLPMSTDVESGGIHNIPFIVKQANAIDMMSTFWIMELDEPGLSKDEPKLVLQYYQAILLDFFPRADGLPGRVRWPHVSINTMEKVALPDSAQAKEDVYAPAS